MAVPLLDVNAQNLQLEGELTAAFQRVLRSGQFIMGPEITAFEEEIARFIGVKHAIGVSSGTDALVLALMALGIGPGDDVLCPTFTFFATAGAIARVGARPIFVDADPVTFNISVADLTKKVTPQCKAIIPVHLFGQAAEMDAVLAIASKHDLRVIEDGAQSLGATYRGKQTGTMGDFGTFSFFPSKNLGGLGDGGLLVSNSDTLAEKARLLRTHGAKPKYYHKEIGGNFRLDALQAALLRVKLPHYNDYTRKRQGNAGFYTEKLSKIPGIGFSETAEEKILIPQQSSHLGHIWNQYTLRILAGRRDAFRDFLAARKIGHEIYYPVSMHRQECFAPLQQEKSCPVADRLAGEVISIPIYPELTRDQQQEVVQAISEFISVVQSK